MRRTAVAVSLLLAAAPLAAQSDPVAYCPTGSAGCFALKTALTQGPGDRMTFSIWIQNLEGLAGYGSGLYGFWGFGITRKRQLNEQGEAVDWMGGRLFDRTFATLEGAVQESESGTQWQDDDRGDEATVDRFTMLAPDGYGLIGCTLPDVTDPPGTSYLLRTCLPHGIDGWARFDIELWLNSMTEPGEHAITRDDFRLEIFDSSEGEGYQQQACVFTGANSGVQSSLPECATFAVTYPPTVTPEPATLALLGTGLAGIGAAVRRRRGVRRV